LDDVTAAVARLAQNDVRVVSLHPARLDDIWGDIERVGEAIHRAEVARTVVHDLKARVDGIARRARGLSARPTVLTVEWMAPVMVGGLWMPELVTLAGGTPLVTQPGDHAPTLTKSELDALDPDVVLIKPCGFDMQRTLKELPILRSALPWDKWRAVREGRVFVADGNAFFNRPGPRIVESLEILAACLHPGAFDDLAQKHAAHPGGTRRSTDAPVAAPGHSPHPAGPNFVRVNAELAVALG
jgi:iron complex transport system substrate-binding protein